MLFVEFHGTRARASRSSRSGSARSPTEFGGGAFEWATKAGRPHPALAGAARRLLGGARLRPGAKAVATDVCVPISRLAECVTETPADIERERPGRADRRPCRRRQFPHAPCWSTWTTPTRSRAPRPSCGRLVERALAMDGTCTGEHGVGQGKMKYLAAEHGAAGLDVMRAIKRAIDPDRHHEPGQDRGRDVTRCWSPLTLNLFQLDLHDRRANCGAHWKSAAKIPDRSPADSRTNRLWTQNPISTPAGLPWRVMTIPAFRLRAGIATE